MPLSDSDVVDRIVENIYQAYPQEYLQQWQWSNRFIKYQNDPVRFGREVLEEHYYPQIEELMNSVRDHSITIAISSNGTGKSFSASSLALWIYFCFPNAKVITIAAPPEKNLKEILWGEINKKKIAHDHLFKGHICNVMDFNGANGSSIRGVTIPQSGSPEEREAKVSGKHAPYMFFVCDESDAIPDEIFKGIESCMSGGWCRMLCMFNPRRMSGAVYNMIRNDSANVVHLSAFDHPNVITGQDVIPGAVSREITVRRINEYSISIPDGEADPNDADHFEVPDFLVGYVACNHKNAPYLPLAKGWRKITNRILAYQTLGRYPKAGSDQLVQKSWYDAARTRWDLWALQYGEKPPEGVRPVAGLDVSDMGEDSNAICLRYGGWVERIKTWAGISPNETADIAADIARDKSVSDVKVDSIGVGADVAPLIKKRGVKATRVIVSEKPTKTHKKDQDKILKFAKLRDQIYWEMREWFESDIAMIPPDSRLMDQVLAVTYNDSLGPLRVDSKDTLRGVLGYSPDEMESLVLTFSPKSRVPHVRSLNS